MSQIVPQLGCPIVVHLLTIFCPGSRDICTHPLIVTVWPTCPILSNLERFIPWNFPPKSSHHGEPAGAYFCLFIRKPPPKKNGGFRKHPNWGEKKNIPNLFQIYNWRQSHINITLGHFGGDHLAGPKVTNLLGNSPRHWLVTLS